MKKIGLLVIIIGVLFVFAFLMTRKTSPGSDQTISECKRIPVTIDYEVQPIKEVFEPLIPPEGEEFYILSTESTPWDSINFDVDGDGKPEDILTANVSMNHTPHVLRIVKDDFVVFKYEGAGVYAEAVNDNNGFILGETIDWNKNQTRRTYYEFKDGRFIPTWYQENCR